MTPGETFVFFAVVFLGVLAIGKVLTIPAFVITKKLEARIDPEVASEWNSRRDLRIVHSSMRELPRRRLRAGQSRRPL